MILDDPQTFRDNLFLELDKLACLGRLYIAREGINAQMSVPAHNFDAFISTLNCKEELKDMPIKWAVEDDGNSFLS